MSILTHPIVIIACAMGALLSPYFAGKEKNQYMAMLYMSYAVVFLGMLCTAIFAQGAHITRLTN